MPAHVVPAAVFLAEIVGEIGHVEELLGIEIGVVEGRQNDVRARAYVRRHRRLRTHVFPALVVDAHLDSGLLREGGDVLHVLILVARDEALPAQHAQLRALLGLPGGLRLGEQRHAARGAGRETGGNLQKIATLDVAHGPSFWV